MRSNFGHKITLRFTITPRVQLKCTFANALRYRQGGGKESGEQPPRNKNASVFCSASDAVGVVSTRRYSANEKAKQGIYPGETFRTATRTSNEAARNTSPPINAQNCSNQTG